jgi:hypothetical protein
MKDQKLFFALSAWKNISRPPAGRTVGQAKNTKKTQ